MDMTATVFHTEANVAADRPHIPAQKRVKVNGSLGMGMQWVAAPDTHKSKEQLEEELGAYERSLISEHLLFFDDPSQDAVAAEVFTVMKKAAAVANKPLYNIEVTQ